MTGRRYAGSITEVHGTVLWSGECLCRECGEHWMERFEVKVRSDYDGQTYTLEHVRPSSITEEAA